ncbi:MULTISPECIES: hypothetical protein [unclassified Pseudoalteromonas]|uniref:hypothetical protein n=1 Tax=unclassified Pseudoalteromonas TaxID=194690 RepID=UPI0018CDA5C0|nr:MULTISPECIES: hypothetical protein [unclassified Pseudoalteromonas]MBH0037664.1 hypothetical protein [Pseudoalteromonas sp. SWN166]MBH0044398.1 hypothetical protein [Pseudoalteromonas sp. SWXJZ10B]
MNLSLKEKQQLRSVIELIVQNPDLAKKLFIDIETINASKKLGALEEIAPLIRLVYNYESSITKPNYIHSIKNITNSLTNHDVKKLVLSTLNAQEISSRNLSAHL